MCEAALLFETQRGVREHRYARQTTRNRMGLVYAAAVIENGRAHCRILHRDTTSVG